MQQARWTKPLRDYLFAKTGLAEARRVLEVGCGTGALLNEMPQRTRAADHGLDLNLAAVKQAHINSPTSAYAQADAQRLPYAAQRFDVVYCHFVLLWLRDPVAALAEMRRVTRRGGYVIALAEPDYSRRVDEPAALAPLGCAQTESLRQQGAQPEIGGQLGALFYQAGITLLETGELQRGGAESFSPAEWELEWAVLASDLTGTLSDTDLQKYKQLDRVAWEQGRRVLHVPTYYAYGRV
jgi:SAM-dependent methyltransferase